ncbi:MFS transporter [Acidiphilium sp. AL]|uniref:MFS transporter n=1 Tax=Acidiphilium sp. AL TaxID=2871704 RepID=UPI0021CAF809|nr:MFS transporter [Acidiphilium sp. AL]MCU4160829.1 MFS transporter [Acidiphilium sp. AL]
MDMIEIKHNSPDIDSYSPGGATVYSCLLVATWFTLYLANSISITDYSLALPFISNEFYLKSGSIWQLSGLLSYSSALWVVYFVNFRGWMNIRVRTAVLISQIVIIVPSILIPYIPIYIVIIFLRFIQGLWFVELGLCTICFSGWFDYDSLSISVGISLAALQVGSAVGGIVTRYVMLTSSWQTGFYVAAGIDVMATTLFFILYRDAPGYEAHLSKDRAAHVSRGHVGGHSMSVWRWPVTYTIGLSQIATTMLFASVPFLVPFYGYAMHLSPKIIANTVILYGLTSGAMIVAGALFGSAIVRRQTTVRDIFRSRNSARHIGHAIATIGLLMLLFGKGITSYVLGSIFASCIVFNIPNYWAELVEVVPSGYRGDFIFAAGAVASFGFLGGPAFSITILRVFHSYSVVWVSLLAIVAISQGTNLWQQRHVALPLETIRTK